MAEFAAFLRAINLGSHKPVAMAALRGFFEGLGFEDVRTFLQTGNVVFRGPAKKTGAIERLLEEQAKKDLGLDTDFFVRTSEELDEIVAANPFPREAESDPRRLVVMFLKNAPAKGAPGRLREAIKGRESVEVAGPQAYVYYADGIGRSRLTNSLLEGRLAARSTGRNWRTVLKLQGAFRVDG